MHIGKSSLLVIDEFKETRDHYFEVELFKFNELRYTRVGKECNSYEETLNFVNELENENRISYHDLTLDYDNKKFNNVKNTNELLSLIKLSHINKKSN